MIEFILYRAMVSRADEQVHVISIFNELVMCIDRVQVRCSDDEGSRAQG